MVMSHFLKARSATGVASVFTVALAAGFVPEATAQLPAVMPIGARVAFSAPQGVTFTNPTKMARDTAGNVFVLDATNKEVLEVPVSGPFQVVVPSTDASMSSGVSAMAVDPAGNIYLTRPAIVTMIPRLANGTYNLAGESQIAPNIDTAQGYYYQPADLAVDGSGNIYMASTNNNGFHVLLYYQASTQTVKYLLGSLTTGATLAPTAVAIDAAGDVFWADGTNVNEMTAASVQSSSPTGIVIGNGACTGCTALSGPKSVYLDKNGNVYTGQITTSRVSVIVNQGGTFSSANPIYALPATISGSSQAGNWMAITNEGDFIGGFGSSLEYYASGSLFEAPSSNVYGAAQGLPENGSSTTAKTPSIAYLFTQSTTLGTPAYAILNAGAANGGAAPSQLASSSSTCTAATTYTAGQTCTVTFGYGPKVPGLVVGGVVLYGTGGTVLNASTATQIVTGAAAAIDMGITTALGAGYTAPAGVAVDNAGNAYVADPSANSVYRIAAGSTAAGTAVGSGLSAPSGVAIDASGNLYIADTGNNRVVYLPNNSGTLGTQTVLATTGFTLSSPRGVAFDGYGRLYIADSGNGRVLRIANPLAGSVNTVPVTVGSGFTTPYAMAFDAYDNMYVADYGANSVVLVPGPYGLTSTGTANVGSGTQVTVGSGLIKPAGVAVDASGSVYVTDSGNSRVVKIPNEAGVITTADQSVLLTGLSRPFGIAADSTADLYLTDQDAPSLLYLSRSAASGGTASTLNFGSVAASGTVNVAAILSNTGLTTSLAVTAISTPTGNFALGSPSSNACGATPTLIAGKGCNLQLTFNAPATSGVSTGTFTVTDNALGATGSTQKSALTGVSGGAVASVTVTGNPSVVYGATEIYTVTAKDSTGAASAAANGTYTVTITGTASSSASVNLTNGTGTFFLPSLGVGSYSLSATIASFAGTQAVSIAKAPLYVTANNISRLFDVANPALTFSFTGFANGDTSSVVSGTAPTIATSANRISPLGSYPITLTGGSLTAANYTISLVAGTLTVTGSVPQAIFFPPLPNFTHGATVTLTGQSTSGMTVTYSVSGGSISGSVLTVGAAGTVSVTATQVGNNTYAAATPVTRSFTAQ